MNFWRINWNKFAPLLFVLLIVSGRAHAYDDFRKCVYPGTCQNYDENTIGTSNLAINSECSFEGRLKYITTLRDSHQFINIHIGYFDQSQKAIDLVPEEVTIDLSLGKCDFTLKVRKGSREDYLRYRNMDVYIKRTNTTFTDKGMRFMLSNTGTLRVFDFFENERAKLWCGITPVNYDPPIDNPTGEGIYGRTIRYSQRVSNNYTNFNLYTAYFRFEIHNGTTASMDETTTNALTTTTEQVTTTEETTTVTDAPTTVSATTEQVTSTEQVTMTEQPTAASTEELKSTEEITSTVEESTVSTTNDASIGVSEECHCLQKWIKGLNPILVMVFFLCLEGAVMCCIVIDMIRYRHLFALVPQRRGYHKSSKGAADSSKKAKKDQHSKKDQNSKKGQHSKKGQKPETPAKSEEPEKQTEGTMDKSVMTPSAQLSKFDEQVQTVRF